MARRRRDVVLLASATTLPGIEGGLRRAGLLPRRVTVLRARARPPSRWVRGTPSPRQLEGIVITSRAAVTSGLLPWLRLHGLRWRRELEVWASGPGTAALLRRRGVRRVRVGPTWGGAGIVRGLALRRSRLLYLRSGRAGAELTRMLRDRGHTVTERIVYDVEVDGSAVARARTVILGAKALVATSPSAIEALHQGLSHATLRRLVASVPLVVLGARSASAGRAAGFARVVTLVPSTPQRFARRLVREVRDVRG